MTLKPRVDLDDGIFNVVISVCQYYAGSVGINAAREYVASYLEKLAKELRSLNEKQAEG